MSCNEEKTCDIWDFSVAPSDSASVALYSPRYAPVVTLRYKVRSCEIRSALPPSLCDFRSKNNTTQKTIWKTERR